MTIRVPIAVSAVAAIAGALVLLLTWFDVVEWRHATSLGSALLLLSLLALAATAVDQLRSIRRDLALVRDRSKSISKTTRLAGARVEEIRDELFTGPFSHVPGQIGRIEGRGAGSMEPLPPRESARLGSCNPNTVFDAVYVLNLDRDGAKREHIEKMLNRHGIRFTRFAAVDGSDPVFDDEWRQYAAADLTLPPERHAGHKLIESRGAWGYLQSMGEILREARNEGYRRILVLDDDVMLHRDFGSRFEQAWTELPTDWVLVYLGSAQVDRSKLTQVTDHLYRPGAMANGSYAFAIDSQVFDQAVASIERFDWPFDAGALREIDASYPTRVFTIHPPLVIADVSRSAIRPGRDLEAHADKHGWNLDDYEDPFPEE